MKILAINSSPRKDKSNTDLLLKPFLEGAKQAGADTEIVYLQGMKIKPCLGCFDCWMKTPGQCIQKDDMAGLLEKLKEANLLVYATPLYVFGMTSTMKMFFDRIIPLAEPYIRVVNGECTHPFRFEQKTSGMVVISNCGFHGAANFDEMITHFKAIARHSKTKFLGALVRPEGEFFPYAAQLMPDKHKAIIEALVEAGKSAVKNHDIPESLQKTISADLMPLATFIESANKYFDHLMSQAKAAKE